MEKRGWITDALHRYERPLVRYAAGMLGDVDAARDVVQDCFLRLCRENPAQLDGHLKAWLYKVCRNRSIDLLRKAGRMDTLDRTDLQSTADTPPASAERREELGLVRQGIAALPARERELVRLKFSEGLTYKEIAAVTELSVSNVGFLLHRALKSLRAQLARSEA